MRRWRGHSLKPQGSRRLSWPACDACGAPLTTNPDCPECLHSDQRLRELLEATQLDPTLLATFVAEENRIFKIAGLPHHRRLPPAD